MKNASGNEKIGFLRLFAWSSRGISGGVQAVLLTFLIIYCTNALGMKPAVVGTILMVSKLLDGVTDLFAGFIVDRTNTKWGRGRPYEFGIIGLWFTTWLLFSVPASCSMVVKCIWVFVCYATTQSLFTTILTVSQTVYMVRAFRDEKQYVTINAIGGLITTVGVLIFNVVFPIFQADIIYSAPGWSRLIAFIALPLGILGMMRFIFIKEDTGESEAETEKIRLKDVLWVLKTNKYIYIVGGMLFLSAIQASLGVSNYYFLYVVKNVKISGIMSIFGLIAMITLVFYPVMMKKISAARLIQMGCALMIPAGILNFYAGKNLGLLGVAGVLMGMATLPISFMNNLLVIECATYNESRNQPRMEGTLTCITGFANKIGAAFGSFLLGILLSVAQFDGTAKVQPESALFMVRFIYGIIPLILGALIIIILHFYKLDKMKPEMLREIEENKQLTPVAE